MLKHGLLLLASILIIILGIVLAIVYKEWTPIFISLIGLISGGVSLARIEDIETSRKKEALDRLLGKLNEFDGFTPTIYFEYIGKILSIDENSSKIAIGDINSINVYNFNDLLHVEVQQDEETITKTSRSSQLGGMAVGGVLAGGLGLAIGAVTANKSSSATIKKMTINLRFDSLRTPLETMVFLNSSVPLTKDSNEVIEAVKRLDHWFNLLHVIISRNEKQNAIN
ncbi:hypothetical protein MKY95_19675 [Paenibacillus sp. FSL P4-0176]|uniref:hypothetical protein n=1 Tax=Paenibacillus sp. FSL P4-0176 TaxID=2921631 RepID=UPI0030CB7F0B